MAIQVYDMGLDFTKGEGTSISDFRLKQAQANQADATANKYRAENDAKQKAAALQAKSGEFLKQTMNLLGADGKSPASEEEKMVHLRGLYGGAGMTEQYAATNKAITEFSKAKQDKAKADSELQDSNSKRYSRTWKQLQLDPSDRNIESVINDLRFGDATDLEASERLQKMYEANKDLTADQRSLFFKSKIHPDYDKHRSVDIGGSVEIIPEDQAGSFGKTLPPSAILTSEDKAKDREQRASQFIKGEAGKNTRAANTIANSGQGKGKLKYITDKTGTVSVLQDGEVVRRIPGIGKQSSDYQKKIITNEDMNRKIDVLIPELESIIEDDGLIDQSTGSGIGALWDLAAGFVGHATKGSIAISRLQPIWDKALKLIPRFEGPQSDKDVKTYKEAAADAANPYLPTERRKAGIGELVRLFKERKGQFTTQKVEDAGGRVEPQQKIRVKF